MTTDTAARHTGTFSIDSWDQQDDDPRDDGFATGRATLTKTFDGGLAGTSTTRILLAGTASGSRAYCGFEHFTGTVGGRTGTFALRHAAEGDADEQWMTWTVVRGSGTGGFVGVHGEGRITRHDDGSHTYWLDLGFA